MIVVFSSNPKDYEGTVRLLEWCKELGRYDRHHALIVAAQTLDRAQVAHLDLLAKDCAFGRVTSIHLKLEDPRGWPYAPNIMFQNAVAWIEQVGRSAFVWVESDATPLKEGWLDAIEQEYVTRARPFMGTIFNWISAQRYLPHLNGNAVYPSNIRQFNPYMLAATQTPWDCTRPDLILPRTHKSNLFHHEWGDRNTNAAPTFPSLESLSFLHQEAVLFHRCKDGSLIDRLREQRAIQKAEEEEEEKPYPELPITRKIIGLLSWPFGPRKSKKKKGQPREMLIVRRTGAFGDVIAATCVSRKLIDMGYDVTFQCHPYVQPVLRLDPTLKAIEETTARDCDVDLNNAYEPHPKRCQMSFAEIYIEAANKQLGKKHIQIENTVQCTPRLVMPENAKHQAFKALEKFPRPWVIIVPRSASHNHRTVPDSIWEEAARHIEGTCFWAGNHDNCAPPKGIKPLFVKSMTEVGMYQSVADLVVSPDTGPLHLAAALGIQTVALLQSSSPELHLSDQNDFEMLAPDGLNCLNCQQSPCPINEHYPPCQLFRPEAISMAVNRKLRRIKCPDEVSAVVTIYRPPAERLNKCLLAVLPQVSEVIVTRNADGIVPSGVMTHPKIRFVSTRLPNVGYGRNANYGARNTASNYVLFLNDDVYLHNETVSHLLSVIKGDQKIGMVGHLLRYPDGTIQHGGTTRNKHDRGWGHVSHRKVTPEINQIIECENVTHASVLMRREAFFKSGCYDERYFMYFEDNALCLQVRQAGWKIIYTPHASAIHDEHQTLKVYPTPQMVDNMRRARAVFDRTWGQYFLWNAKRPLGNFDYLNQ